MAKKPKRDFKKEAKFHARPEQKKRRAARNKARRQAIRDGRVKKGDGKEIDHKDFNPKNNSKKNVRVVSRSTNRRRQPKTKTRRKS